MKGVRHMKQRALASNINVNGTLRYTYYEHYRRESPLALGQGFLLLRRELDDKAVVERSEKKMAELRLLPS